MNLWRLPLTGAVALVTLLSARLSPAGDAAGLGFTPSTPIPLRMAPDGDRPVAAPESRRPVLTTSGPGPTASCPGAPVLAVTPASILPGQSFTLSWCDPSWGSCCDECYGVDAYYVIFSRVGSGTRYAIDVLPPSQLSKTYYIGQVGTYEFSIGVDGYSCSAGGTVDADLESNVATLLVERSETEPCVDDFDNGRACLRDGRFELVGVWQGFWDDAWRPILWKRYSDETLLGVFENNVNDVTVLAKIVWGCPLNWNYWFWLGGFTTVGWEIRVRDRWTGTEKTYSRARDDTSYPTTIRDATSFPCP